MAENEHLCDKLAIYFGRLFIVFEQNNHALTYVLPADFLQSKTSALAGAASRDTYTLALYASDAGSGEVAKAVGSDEHSVTRMDHARLDHTRNDCADEGD